MGLLCSTQFCGFFKDAFSYEERKKLCDKMIRDNPKKLPIICESIPDNDLPYIQKILYMVGRNATILNLSQKMRNEMRLNPQQEKNFMFLIMSNCGNAWIWRCPRKHEKIFNLYNDNKDKDGFFYIKMCNKEKINWNDLPHQVNHYRNDS